MVGTKTFGQLRDAVEFNGRQPAFRAHIFFRLPTEKQPVPHLHNAVLGPSRQKSSSDSLAVLLRSITCHTFFQKSSRFLCAASPDVGSSQMQVPHFCDCHHQCRFLHNIRVLGASFLLHSLAIGTRAISISSFDRGVLWSTLQNPIDLYLVHRNLL